MAFSVYFQVLLVEHAPSDVGNQPFEKCSAHYTLTGHATIVHTLVKGLYFSQFTRKCNILWIYNCRKDCIFHLYQERQTIVHILVK